MGIALLKILLAKLHVSYIEQAVTVSVPEDAKKNGTPAEIKDRWDKMIIGAGIPVGVTLDLNFIGDLDLSTDPWEACEGLHACFFSHLS